MTEWRVSVSAEAVSDLDEIYFYILNTLLSPSAAKSQIGRLKAAISGLSIMPKRHPAYKAEPWKSRGYRQMTVNNYAVIYRTNDDTCEVIIMRALYARRDMNSVLTPNIPRTGETRQLTVKGFICHGPALALNCQLSTVNCQL